MQSGGHVENNKVFRSASDTKVFRHDLRFAWTTFATLAFGCELTARWVLSITWNPDGGKKVAVSYSILQFQRQPEGMSLNSYVWYFLFCPLTLNPNPKF